MVSLGTRRPFRNLCRTCWGVETRSSNSRLITALNEMTRGGRPQLERSAHSRPASKDGSREMRDRRRDVVERRGDPERPRWHP